MRSAYVDRNFYSQSYHGKSVPDEDFDRIALRASESFDRMTFNRVLAAGLSTYDTDTQESIKLATSALLEGIYLEEQFTNGIGAEVQAESIAGIHNITYSSGGVDRIRANAQSTAETYLLYTGLMYRGVSTSWAL